MRNNLDTSSLKKDVFGMLIDPLKDLVVKKKHETLCYKGGIWNETRRCLASVTKSMQLFSFYF